MKPEALHEGDQVVTRGWSINKLLNFFIIPDRKVPNAWKAGGFETVVSSLPALKKFQYLRS